jgi:site-specific DNA-cytosine methylase
LTRSERVKQVKAKPEYFDKYGDQARRVIEALLEKFAEEGYLTFDKVLDASQLADPSVTIIVRQLPAEN